MKEIIKVITSSEDLWDKGMRFGVALVIISLLAMSQISISSPYFSFNYSNQFDWWTILFIGLAIFFFFMAIRLNTEISVNKNITNLSPSNQQTNTFTSYQTHLDRFNILSKSCFTISGISVAFSILRMLTLFIIKLV